jgi:hypothetical protein
MMCRYFLPKLLVEPQQRRSILGLDDRDDLGIDALVDDLRDHPRARLVHRLLRELDPADPVVATVSDDLNVLRLVLGLSVEATTVLAKPGPSRR